MTSQHTAMHATYRDKAAATTKPDILTPPAQGITRKLKHGTVKAKESWRNQTGTNDEGCSGRMQTAADCLAVQKSLLTVSQGTIGKQAPRTF